MSQAIHRMGPMEPQEFAVDSGTVIAKGDLLWLDTDDVKPSADFTWDTNIATTQALHNIKFCGVAMDAHAAGTAGTISVDTGALSVYEFDCASATFVTGAPIGVAKASGNALENQKVVAAAVGAAIGRVYKAGTSITRVQCTLASAFSTASNNVNGIVG